MQQLVLIPAQSWQNRHTVCSLAFLKHAACNGMAWHPAYKYAIDTSFHHCDMPLADMHCLSLMQHMHLLLAWRDSYLQMRFGVSCHVTDAS